MPFFDQENGGACWANCGKMLQKGLYPGGLAFNKEIFEFMLHLNISLNGGIYSDSDYSRFAHFIGNGKTIKWEEYYSFSSALKKIIEQLNRGNPVIFVRLDHMVLVVGYEKDAAGDLYLIQHNPKAVGSEGGFYESQNWKDIATLWNWQDVIALIWAADTPDPNRALQSINLPGQVGSSQLYFFGRKNNIGDPTINLQLTFDNTVTDGYRWSRPQTTSNINHLPKNVSELKFEEISVFNADINNSANVTFGIKVYEKDEPSNAAIFSKDLVIPPKKNCYTKVNGKLDLTPVRLNVEEESECVLYITLEKGSETTTSIIINDFFLQPLELKITLSIPGETTDTSGNYKIAADGKTYTINAEVKDQDGNTVPDGTEVEFAKTAGSPGTLSTTTATTTDGEATVTLTSPTAIGSAEITAKFSKINGSTKVDFVAGPISTLALSTNPTTLPADGTSTSTIQIKAGDANGNPVADSDIKITAVSGSLTAASATTDKNGVATIVYISPATVPQGGTDTVTATSNNAIATTGGITIEEPLSWSGWPDAQWCPNTGSDHTIYNPGGDPDEIECEYCGVTPKYLCRETPYKDGKKNGIEKYYYEDGKIMQETPWVNGKRDGTEKWYYTNGQLKHERPWVDNKFNGIEKTYYENGQLHYEWPWVDDKRHGVTKKYYSNGQLQHEYHYVDYVLHGTSKTWSENGELTGCVIWENGTPVGSCMP